MSRDGGEDRSRFFGEYDLDRARRLERKRTPAIHQKQALEKLALWSREAAPPRGGILVLPTGGGKTFTALRYLCAGPLSDGYKVLWLAHTHHLLEQAYEACESSVGEIAEPKSILRVRVVSGTAGHWRVNTIASDDDVVIATLQTIVQAKEQLHPALEGFLEASGGKLIVVFDEAHHSPAPSYRKLMMGLRERYPEMKLLGLTATPTYNDEKKRGWLSKLFPQGIVYQTTPGALMASGVLARPQMEEEKTQVVPDFDEPAFRRWKATFQDLPESIVESLASDRARNEVIATTYVEHRKKYGKTIIFADRWYQCEFIVEALGRRGVKAGAVYSHVDGSPGTPEQRNQRSQDENAKVLERFKRGELEVLLNVRMMTEGTDVPDVQTVFITRQTTSRILLTQMIGRALRGPKFGGTKDAFIVFFVDEWRQFINFAEYDQLEVGPADESETEYGKRPPLQLISIDLVRRLAQQLDSGINVASRPYLSLLPLGWYRVSYDVLVEGSEDVENRRALVLVFEEQKQAYEDAIAELQRARTDGLASESASFEPHRAMFEKVRTAHFRSIEEHDFTDLLGDLFQIARHIAQADGEAPTFFSFESRQAHDLDAIAAGHIAEDLGPSRVKETLSAEYERVDRFWREIYPRFGLYKSEYDSVVNRLLDVRAGTSVETIVSHPAKLPDREPPTERKQLVFDRDKRCLCCGSTKRLRADHVKSAYLGGGTEAENLQTLCESCNGHKSTRTVDFRRAQTPHAQPPEVFPFIERDTGGDEGSRWERELRRALNFFFECASVERVDFGDGRNWVVELATGNDPRWLDGHMNLWVKRIHAKQSQEDEPRVQSLTVRSADGRNQATYTSTRPRE